MIKLSDFFHSGMMAWLLGNNCGYSGWLNGFIVVRVIGK